MRHKLKVIIPSGIALITIVVLVVLNPLGLGAPTAGNSTGNSTIDGNGGNGNANPTNDSGGEGEVTNPGNETIPMTFRITPGKFWLDDEDHTTEVRQRDGTVVTQTVHGTGIYQAGKSREYQLMVTNKNAWAANFTIDYRVPDNVLDGYSRPTSEVRDWVWISNRKPTIGAGETMTITIRLGMPGSATAPGERWEFWIGVIDKSQTGWIRTELANRWLVTMAH